MHIEGWIHSVHFGGIDTHVNFRRIDTQCGGMNTQCGFRGLDITVRSYCVYRECHGGPALHKEIYILNLSTRVLAKAIAGGSPPLQSQSPPLLPRYHTCTFTSAGTLRN